jgi:hypothetical protein
MIGVASVWFITIVSLVVAVKLIERDSTPLTKEIYTKHHRYHG